MDLVVDCLESTDNTMVSHSLKVVHCVMKWDLMKNKLKTIFDQSLKLLQKLSVHDLELIKNNFMVIHDLLEIRYFVDDG